MVFALASSDTLLFPQLLALLVVRICLVINWRNSVKDPVRPVRSLLGKPNEMSHSRPTP